LIMKHFATIVSVCFALMSCQLVKEVDVTAPPPSLVVNSLFESDTTWRVFIGRSTHVLDSTAFRIPEGELHVSIIKNNTDVIELEEVFNSNIKEFQVLARSQPGETYSITVTCAGFPPAHATSRAPSIVEIASAHLDSAHLIPENYYGPASIPIEFTFQDPPDQKDYYLPLMEVKTNWKRYNPQTKEYEDFIQWIPCRLTEIPPGAGLSSAERPVQVISDELFNGKLHSVRLYATKLFSSSSEEPTYPWRLYVMHINEDYYRYWKSVSLQRDTDDNPLAQPVQIFTNIEGGYGIFAGSATSIWEQK